MTPELANQPSPLVSVDLQRLVVPSVAVLYARRDSIYKTMPECDVWDEDRDARKYDGTLPIIAHPPCRAWSALSHLAKPRHDEKDLARIAVAQVRRCKGVLEHPATSRLWKDQLLPEPGTKDEYGGWTLAAPQWWWGHKAMKNTRLYIVGCPADKAPEIPLKLGEPPCVVTTSRRKCETPPDEWKPRLYKTSEREGTPIEFARWLVATAKLCAPNARMSDEPKASSSPYDC